MLRCPGKPYRYVAIRSDDVFSASRRRKIKAAEKNYALKGDSPPGEKQFGFISNIYYAVAIEIQDKQYREIFYETVKIS